MIFKNLVYWKVMKTSLRRHELDIICMIYRFTTYRLDIFLDTFVKIYRFSCLLSVYMTTCMVYTGMVPVYLDHFWLPSCACWVTTL